MPGRRRCTACCVPALTCSSTRRIRWCRCGLGPGGGEGAEDRSYFATSHVNDTFPARGATEHQVTLAQLVMTVLGAGFELLHLAEHPDPFWRPDGDEPAAAWDGRLPNALSLLARRS